MLGDRPSLITRWRPIAFPVPARHTTGISLPWRVRSRDRRPLRTLPRGRLLEELTPTYGQDYDEQDYDEIDRKLLVRTIAWAVPGLLPLEHFPDTKPAPT